MIVWFAQKRATATPKDWDYGYLFPLLVAHILLLGAIKPCLNFISALNSTLQKVGHAEIMITLLSSSKFEQYRRYSEESYDWCAKTWVAHSLHLLSVSNQLSYSSKLMLIRLVIPLSLSALQRSWPIWLSKLEALRSRIESMGARGITLKRNLARVDFISWLISFM